MVFARATCAHVTCGRTARVRMSHCVAVFMLLALVFGLMRPVRAFAAGSYSGEWYSILYQSSLDDAEQYIVGADDKWQAAAIICGKSKSFIDGLDDAIRKKLATNGGSFQTLAESLTQAWPGWNEETLEDSLSEVFGGGSIGSLWFNMTSAFTVTNTYPFVGFNSSALSLFTVVEWQQECPISIFAINVDPTLRAAAIEALNFIVGGGTIGGAYDGPVPDGYEVIGSGIGTRNDKLFTLERYGETAVSQSCNLDLNNIDSIWTYDQYVVVAKQRTNRIVSYLVVSFETGLIPMRNLSNNSLSIYNPTNEPLMFSYSYNESGAELNSSTGIHVAPVGNYYMLELSVAKNTRWNLQSTYIYPIAYVGTSNYMGGSNVGDDEPNPWPEPDPPVEPPDVPNPPVVTPPPVGGPSLPTDPPADPTPTPEPEPTGTDYTTYLKAIIRQLNQVMVQMSNHCKHIRDQISTSANAIISNMHSFFEDLVESIDTNFSTLNDYLEDLTKWYEGFTNDIVDGIQDEISTIESILRQILRKIGVTRGTPREIETEVDDDFNFLEWLINFITSKLSGVIGDFVGDVGGLIAGVKDKFPFSIPWDIAAILALLDGVPTTPVFTITIPAVNGWWQETRFVIDLHPYDSVASAARIMINAWWVLVLVMKTNWLLMIMGDSTSIGERIANRMTGGE